MNPGTKYFSLSPRSIFNTQDINQRCVWRRVNGRQGIRNLYGGKDMKKTIKKRAFVSAIAMLIVSAIVLTSSTFAWFSMSKEASVESMDLTVSSPEGIQISANASTWTANLTIDEIFHADTSTSRYKAYENNINLMPADLIPVSSCLHRFNSTTGTANFFKVTLNDSGYGTVTNVNQVAGNDNEAGLVAFDLFFKLAKDTKVYFGTSEFVDNSDSDILTAMRVAFQFLGNTSSTVADDAIALKTTSASTSIIYEIDSTGRSADAISAGNSTGYIATSYVKETNASQKVNSNFVLSNSYVGAPSCTVLKDTDAKTAKSFDLKAGVSKVRIYIWVEGQDIDCRNSVAGAALSAALKFTID